jgi:3-hydroxybutyryl-CoA dehydrogenase
MREGHIGLTTGKGFLDYEKLDLEAYRADRLRALVAMLGFLGLTRPPVLPEERVSSSQ